MFILCLSYVYRMFIVFRIMEIKLSPICESLTGSLGRGFGYHIQRRKNGFFAKRNSKGSVPPDGHWRFILACAELAKMKLHVTDIEIHWMELQTALYEAHHFVASEHVRRNYADKAKLTYNAADIVNLKITFGL